MNGPADMCRREGLVRAALVAGALMTTAVLLEAMMRSIPALWPPGSYGIPRFSPDLSMRVHAAPVVYNRVRWTRRVPNRDGFLDVDHAEEKPSGVTRVGFFGDSHVEALQVPLEDTFFRKLPPVIAGHPIEAFGFGISGWGTLHSLIAYRVIGRRYDLDHVTYLFYANDPGDHYSKTQRRPAPSAELSDEGVGYVVKHPPPSRDTRIARTRQFVERTLIARLLRMQLTLLGAKFGAMYDHLVSPSSRTPDPNDWPSTWPPALLEEAQLLTRRILTQFREEVVRDGRTFMVMYVPHGNEEVRGRLGPGQSWFPWLSETCAELGIELLDPRERLREEDRAGRPTYDDHWSPAGHAVIASVMTERLAAGRAAVR